MCKILVGQLLSKEHQKNFLNSSIWLAKGTCKDTKFNAIYIKITSHKIVCTCQQEMSHIEYSLLEN